MFDSDPAGRRQYPQRRRPTWPVFVVAAVCLLILGVGVGVLLVGGSNPSVLTGQGTALGQPVRATPNARTSSSPASAATSTAASSSTSAAAPTAATAPPTFAAIYAAQRSGVVRIEVLGCTDRGIGTGFLLSPRLVATVDHVVAGSWVVSLVDGHQRTTGQVIGTDATNDLALVRTAQPLTGYHFTFATSAPRVGDEVAAIGFPIGGPITLTQGGVSGLHRSITVEGQRRTDMIETDAALNPGNSGGPLLAQDGRVIGLVDAGDPNANGIGYAVPATQAEPAMQQWTTTPTAAPPAACANPLGPRQVHPSVPAPAGLDRAAAHGIATTLATYFAGINTGDYWSAYETFSPAIKAQFSESAFAAGDATSYDFDQQVLAARSTGASSADVALSFTSLQAASKGPNGDTCDVWRLTYHMTKGAGTTWYINGTDPYGASNHTSC